MGSDRQIVCVSVYGERKHNNMPEITRGHTSDVVTAFDVHFGGDERCTAFGGDGDALPLIPRSSLSSGGQSQYSAAPVEMSRLVPKNAMPFGRVR